MKKYDLRKIMKRAWELVKKAGMNISSGLKKAWEEAKTVMENKKEIIIKKLKAVAAEKNSYDNGYHYEVSVSNWENYGKSRTYIAIIETRNCSKHYVKSNYGYYDNIADEYVPHKYGNIEKEFARM